MNQPGLNALFAVIQALNESEVRTARQYLLAFTKRKESEYAKSLRLFDYLRKKKEEKNSDIQIHDVLFIVYGGQRDSAFDRLVIRLRDKILESLCLQTNIERKGVYSLRSKMQLELKTKISYSKIILMRGLDDVSGNIFMYCIDIAKKFELYDELLQATEELMLQASLKNNRRIYDKLLNQYDFYNGIRREVHLAQRTYTSIISFDSFFINGKTNHNEILSELKRLEISHKQTGSNIIQYYYLYLYIHYLQTIKNYKEAKLYFKKLNSLILSHPYICSTTQRGLILASCGENDLYLLQVESALVQVNNSLEFVKPKSFNEGAIRLLLATIYFYNSKYKEALEEITLIQKIKPNIIGSHLTGRSYFLQSALYFITGDFHKCSSLLHQLNPVEEDSEGWNIGIRLLTIQTHIELEQFDEAEKAINNLYHHYRRASKISPRLIDNERLGMLLTILRRLMVHSFDFKKVYQEQKIVLDNLENDSELCWQISSPELINFSKWFFYKSTKQHFRQNLNDIKSQRKTMRKESA